MVSEQYRNIDYGAIPSTPQMSASGIADIPAEKEENRTVYMEATDQIVEMSPGAEQSFSAIMSQGFKKGNDGLELMALSFDRLNGGEVTEAKETRMGELRQSLGEEIITGSLAKEMARASSQQSPQLLLLAETAIKRTIQTEAIFVGGAMAFSPPGTRLATVPGAFALANYVGPQLAVAEVSFELNSAEAFDEFSQMTDKHGNKMDEGLARFGGYLVGAINAGIDLLPFAALKRAFGIGKTISKLEKTGATGVILSKGVGKRAIGEMIMDFNIAFLVEAGAEFTQEQVKGHTGKLLSIMSNLDIEAKTASQIVGNGIDAAKEVGLSFPGLALPGVVVRGGVEFAGVQAAKKQEVAAQQAVQDLTDTITQVAKDGIDSASPEVASFVARKMINGEELSTHETQIGNDILLEARISLAQQEGVPISRIQEQQKALQQEGIENIQAEIDDIRINTLREIELIQEDVQGIDQETATLLEDMASLLSERRKIDKPQRLTKFLESIGGLKDESKELESIGISTKRKLRNDEKGMNFDDAALRAFEQGFFSERPTVEQFIEALGEDFNNTAPLTSSQTRDAFDRLGEIDTVLSKIDQALGDKGIGTDARVRLKELRKRITENKRIAKKTASFNKKIDKKISKLEGKKEKLGNSPPAILADKLKTFRQGLRAGKISQRKETKVIQKELNKIIKESGLDVGQRFSNRIAEIQTFEQFDAQIGAIVAQLKQMAQQHRAKVAVKKIENILKQKNIKPTKQSGKPVGKFTPQIQETLEVLSKHIKLTRDEAVAKLQSRLSDVKEIPTPQDALINMALAIAANKRGKKGSAPSPIPMSAKQIENFAEDLATFVTGGRIARKNSILAKQEKLADLQIKSFENLDNQGESIDLIDETKFWRKVGNSYRNTKSAAYGWYNGWYDVPDVVFRGEKRLVESLRIGNEISHEKGIIREMSEALEEIGIEAFGLNDKRFNSASRQFRNRMEQDSVSEVIGDFVRENGKPIKWQMSKQEMRKLWMEMQDTTLHETLFSEDGNAITQKMVDALNTYLTPEDKAFARAQMDLYSEFYGEINEVYSRVYGINLPINEFYSPISRKIDTEFATDQFLSEQQYRTSVAPGGLKDRVKNIRELSQKSDIAVFQLHVAEMAHFIAFQEKNQELQAVFKNGTIRDHIDKRYGTKMTTIIDSFLDIIIRGGVERAGAIGQMINTLNSNFAVSALMGKIALTAKQLTSFIAAIDRIPITAFTAGVADFALNPKKAVTILSKSELMQERGTSIDKDMNNLGRQVNWNLIRKKQKFSDMLLLPIKVGDRGAIFLGGWTIYKHAKDQGKTDAQAMSAFEEWVSTTQQSRDIDQLSLLQAGSPFVRTFTMFTSAPAAYLRAEVRAIRQWKRGEISSAQAAKKIILYHVVIPSVFQFVSSGFDWDEKKQLRAAIAGPINGFAIMGDIVAAGVNASLGEKAYFDNQLKFMQWAREIFQGGSKIINDLTWEEFMDAIADLDPPKGSGKIASGLGRGLGLPVDMAKGAIHGVELAGEGDASGSALRFFGWPASVIPKDKSSGSGKRRKRRSRERRRR